MEKRNDQWNDEKLQRRVGKLEDQLDVIMYENDVLKFENEQLRLTWGMALEALKIELGQWTSVFSRKEMLERLAEEDFISDAFKLPFKLDTVRFNEAILSQEANARHERARKLLWITSY